MRAEAAPRALQTPVPNVLCRPAAANSPHLQLLWRHQVDLVQQDDVGKSNLVDRLVHIAIAGILEVLHRQAVGHGQRAPRVSKQQQANAAAGPAAPASVRSMSGRHGSAPGKTLVITGGSACVRLPRPRLGPLPRVAHPAQVLRVHQAEDGVKAIVGGDPGVGEEGEGHGGGVGQARRLQQDAVVRGGAARRAPALQFLERLDNVVAQRAAHTAAVHGNQVLLGKQVLHHCSRERQHGRHRSGVVACGSHHGAKVQRLALSPGTTHLGCCQC